MGVVPRLIIAGALVLLGAISIQRLRLEYLPAATSPDAYLFLSLPESTTSEDVTRRWVVPVESRIRAAGDVRAIRGEVSSAGAFLQARFRPGTDVQMKTARILSELSPIRASLPEGGRIDLITGSDAATEPAAFLILSGPAAREVAERATEELRGIKGVKNVEVYGAPRQEITVRVGAAADAEAIAAATRQAIQRSRILQTVGRADHAGRSFVVLSGQEASPRVERTGVSLGGFVTSVGSIASVTTEHEPGASVARYDGQPAVAVAVFSEVDLPTLQFDRALRSGIAGINRRYDGRATLSILISSAEPLRRLLTHVMIGFLLALAAATVAGIFLGGFRLAGLFAASLVIAVAATANAFWLAGTTLNVATLVAAIIAVGAAFSFAVLSKVSRAGRGLDAHRRSSPPPLPATPWFFVYAVTGLLPSIAVALGGGALAPRLAEPARAFSIALIASVGAIWLLPALTGGMPPKPRFIRQTRSILRDPLTILLFAGTLIAVSLTLFGSSLDPRSRSLDSSLKRMVAHLSLPEGTTLEQTAALVTTLEENVATVPAVEHYSSWIQPGRARIMIDLSKESRRPRARERARMQLLNALQAGGGAVRLTSGMSETSRDAESFSDDLEERSRTDEDVHIYRFLLKSTEIDSLRVSAARVRERLSTTGIRGFAIREESAARSIRIDLVPHRSMTLDEKTEVAASLRHRSMPPQPILLAGRDQPAVRVYSRQSPRKPGFVPQRYELLDSPIMTSRGLTVPRSRFQTSETLILSALTRQGGRFIIPFTVSISERILEERKAKREKVDRNLALMALPSGVELERPSLSPWQFSREKLRMYSIAAMLPLIWLAFATVLLNSMAKAVDALVPFAVGLAVVAPMLVVSRSRIDEMTLFAIAIISSGLLPAALLVLHRAGDIRAPKVVASAYRIFREATPPLLTAAVVILLLLAGSSAGADASEDPWVVPLRAAGAAGGAAGASIPFVLSSLVLTKSALIRRTEDRARHLRRPPQWEETRAPVTLSVRSLTKRYGNGVIALRDVSFELRPGIVGLLGPNGAGKTTLLRLLTGLLLPTRGQVSFRGVPVVPENLAEYRRHIGFLPQEFNAYPGFTAAQFLDYWALERGMVDPKERESEIEMLLTAVGLEGEGNRKVRDFSGGMRQRIGIARALLAAPPVLIVDEPTTGLDIESRNRFRGVILSIAVHRIVILSTHIAGDVEATASRILLIHRGRVKFDGAPMALIERAKGRVFEAIVPDEDVRHFSERYRITARVRTLEGIRIRAVTAPNEAPAGKEVEPSLEEAYLAETDLADVSKAGWKTRSRFSFLTEKSA